MRPLLHIVAIWILVVAYPVSGNNSSDALLLEDDRLLAQLSEMCPAALSTHPPYDRSKEKSGSLLNVSLTFGWYAFNGIDVETNSMSVVGAVILSWTFPCKFHWWNKQFSNIDTLTVSLSVNGQVIGYDGQLVSGYPIWTPPVSHANSIADLGAVKKYLSLFDSGLIGQAESGDGGSSTAVAQGLYVSSCNLASGIKKFPLDRHSCAIEFLLVDLGQSSKFVNLTWPDCFDRGYGFVFDPTNSFPTEITYGDFMPETDYWNVVGMNCSFKVQHDLQSAVFTIDLQRKAEHYLYSIFLPCLSLQLLKLFGFAIPTGSEQRPGYSVTIVLTFYFIQSLIQADIPKTSLYMYIDYYLIGDLAISLFITGYFCFDIHLARKLKQQGKRFRCVSAASATDYFTFVLAFAAFITLNCAMFLAVISDS